MYNLNNRWKQNFLKLGFSTWKTGKVETLTIPRTAESVEQQETV